MTLFVVAPDELLTNGWKLLEQGPESQSASAICSGGVSAVMGSSDLDAHTLVIRGASGNQLSCSLPPGAIRPNVEMAWLAPYPMTSARVLTLDPWGKAVRTK